KKILNINYGFPFPIYSETQKAPFKKKCSVNIFLRGEQVRSFQRNELIQMTTNYVEWNDKQEFLKLFKELIKKSRRAIYVDPYDFIGDSYSGLEMLDSLMDNIKLDEKIIYSKVHQHHEPTTNVKPYSTNDISNEIKPLDIIMKPDFLESHWNNTKEVVSCMKNDSIVFVPGRHLIIEKKNNNLIINHLKAPDLFLCETNIEDYMSNCLKPFGIKKSAKINKKEFRNTFSFFINPFANDELRFINPRLVFETYKNLLKINQLSEIHIIGGYHNNINHKEWVSELFEFMKTENNNLYRISIHYYNNLVEISKHMQERRCSALLTADTSVAHATNRWGYPNLTVYNTRWWDKNSVQSLAGSSPIGFNRYFLDQMPLIDSGNPENYTVLGKLAAEALLFLQKSNIEKKELIDSSKIRIPKSLSEYSKLQKKINQSPINWAANMYCPKELICNIITNKKNLSQLIDTAIKISPIYKLAKYNTN
ncbi:MAG: hypothetical protein KKC26_05550, partial [Nanoarchaeota archaeon]|nr:hypothetical protein [Nanoarchaeota archaeon]